MTRKTLNVSGLLAACLGLFALHAPHASAAIVRASAVSTPNAATFGSSINNIINNSGLPPVTDANHASVAHELGFVADIQWVDTTATTGEVTFAFDSPVQLDEIVIWNYSQSTLTSRGIDTFDIFVDTGSGFGVTPVAVGDINSATYTVSGHTSQTVSIAPQLNVVGLRLDNMTNQGSGNSIGLDEVLFRDSTTAANPNQLLIDFGSAAPQNGFVGQDAVDATYNLPFGTTVTVDVPGGVINTRADTGVSSSGSELVADGLEISNLLRDFYFLGPATSPVEVTISGVTAGATVELEAWLSDVTLASNFDVDQRIEISTDNGSTFTSFPGVSAAGLNATPEFFSVVSEGQDIIVQFYEDNTFNQIRLNGLGVNVVNIIVPEPGTMLLCLSGALLGLGFVTFRRFQHNQIQC